MQVLRAVVHRPGFTGDLLAFDSPSIKQILDKCTMLQDSPEEGGKAKARLSGRNDNLHRLRTGDFRIFYTYDDEKVSLWGVRRKTVKGEYRGKKGGDVTYDGIDDVEDDDLDLEIPELAPQRTFEEWVQPVEQTTALPEPITVELLHALEVPLAFHARLAPLTSQEELLECPGVPADYLLAIDRHMFEEPIGLRASEPELVATGGIDDLMKYTEGELVGFLLRLNPEQEKYVTWAANANGPTLVKGGPGTGKSTVAIYRTREMIRVLRESGVEEPRILFTTYTNALVTFSRQLLGSLLGPDAMCVEVKTADKVVASVLGSNGVSWRQPNAPTKRSCETSALANAKYSSNVLKGDAQKRAVEKLGRSYLFEEIETVIQARGLTSVEEYLEATRPGRRIPLNEGKRRAVWAVAQSYEDQLKKVDRMTWQQGRACAARLSTDDGASLPSYDAVVIDEAQDLDASALALLVNICAQPNRLFLTADANQSIYSAGFSWSAVHEDLQFKGRTGILRANHRSTEQITEGARGYLNVGIADDEAVEEQTYVHTGGALPAIRSVDTSEAEADLVARFVRGATRDLRMTIGSAAVLVPTKHIGRTLAERLEERGIPAEFHESRDVTLDDNSVTVLSLLASKGLEFPVVAVAGFRDGKFPHLEDDWDSEMQLEALSKARRQLFVAMTRAMRALLVVTPERDNSILYDGFDPTLWNVGQTT